MHSRSEILKAAWNAYRIARLAIFAAGDTADRRVFLRPFFGKMLRKAWADAKQAAAVRAHQKTAQRFVEAQRRVEADKAAAMEPAARSAAISRVRDELATLDYAPLGVRVAQRRADLRSELSALTAA